MDGSTPHPTLAGFLGLIPGVGAMYNGQFAKGIVHLLVFVVLVALKDSVSDIIGLVVAVWVIYMVIDAYQTAKARRYGYPLPDPFGLNNVGERLGIKNWVAGPPRPAGAPAWTPGQPGPYGAAATQPAPDWVGYVPPTNYATMPGAAVPPDMPVPPPPVAAYAEVPYAAPTAGYVYPGYTQPYAPVAPVATAVPVVPVVPQKRFPTAALWLLVLGAMFLPGTLNHEWRFSFRWMLPTFLAGLSVWTTLRRIGMLGGLRAANLICSLRTPALLMTLAVLFALQDWQFLTLGQTWPVFFIVLGGMLLLERTAGKTTVYGHPPPVADSMDADPGRWTATGDATTSDASKGGQ